MQNTEEFILEQANKKILASRPAGNRPIGHDIYNWLGKVTKNTRNNSNVVAMFGQIAGDEMMANCQPQSLRNGVLKIKVRPGPYMFQMRSMSSQFLKQLQSAYPSANIKEIKLVAN